MTAPTAEIGFVSTGDLGLAGDVRTCLLVCTDNPFNASQAQYGALVEVAGSVYPCKQYHTPQQMILGAPTAVSASVGGTGCAATGNIEIVNDGGLDAASNRAYVLIDNEIVAYNGISGGILQVTQRGCYGSTAASHAAGAAVEQLASIAVVTGMAFTIRPYQTNDYEVHCDYRVLTSDADTNDVAVQYSPDGGTTWKVPSVIDGENLAVMPGDPPVIQKAPTNQRQSFRWRWANDVAAPDSDLQLQIQATDLRDMAYQIMVPGVVTPGTAFTIEVQATYASGSVLTGYSGAALLTLSDGSLSVGQINPGDWVNGVARFSAVFTAGTKSAVTVTVTDQAGVVTSGGDSFLVSGASSHTAYNAYSSTYWANIANPGWAKWPFDSSFLNLSAFDLVTSGSVNQKYWGGSFYVTNSSNSPLQMDLRCQKNGDNSQAYFYALMSAFQTAGNVSVAGNKPLFRLNVVGGSDYNGYLCYVRDTTLGKIDIKDRIRIRFVYDKNYYPGKPFKFADILNLPDAYDMTVAEWANRWQYYDCNHDHPMYIPLDGLDLSTPAPNGYVLIVMVPEMLPTSPLSFFENLDYNPYIHLDATHGAIVF